MNRPESALFLAILALYFPAFGLYHLMVARVNRQQPPNGRIPHSLFRGNWKRLEKEYKAFYPRSVLYQLTLSCAVSLLILALALVAFRFWEYASGK